MADRTVEDRLREEYFALLPDIRRVAEHLEAEVRYHVLPISDRLELFEQLVVSSRIKECESAIQKLRRHPGREGATFDPDRADKYTLTDLKDLAAVRVLVFPSGRREEIDAALRAVFPEWTADPFQDDPEEKLGFKYWGYCPASTNVRGEYQVVSALTGLFWEIEHAAIYKPLPRLRGVAREPGMKERSRAVLNALREFEEEFERLVREGTSNASDAGR